MIGLTDEEQAHVRRALRFVRTRGGGWASIAKPLGYTKRSLINVDERHRSATPALAFRLARLAGVPIDDLLAGKWPPPDACAHCGRA